jgi:hypothetical protein
MSDRTAPYDHLDVGRATEMVQGVKFYKEDRDHVLRRRFERLHLYNLFSKHSRLVDLDTRIAQLEERVEDAAHPRPGQPLPDVHEVAKGINDLIGQIDQALRDFGISPRRKWAIKY